MGDLSAGIAKIEGSLADLRVFLAPMVGSWSGSATQAYGRLQKKWDGGGGSALGAPWGGDAQGRAFAGGYEPKAVATVADRVGAGLATVGDGLDAMGTNHAVTDTGVRSGMVAR